MTRPLLLGLALGATLLLAGCSGGAHDVRFAGQLDRALTPAEDNEANRVFGRAPEVTATDIFCPPDVDPYDCNQHWLSVGGLTMGHCRRALDTLADRTYWRGAPTCGRMPA